MDLFQMPMLSINNGKHLLNTENSSSGDSPLIVPRSIGIETYSKLCLAGSENELPGLSMPSIAKLVVWFNQN